MGNGVARLNLFGGEGPARRSSNEDRADGLLVPTHRHDEETPDPGRTGYLEAGGRNRARRFDVGHVNDGVLADGPARRGRGPGGGRVDTGYGFRRAGPGPTPAHPAPLTT